MFPREVVCICGSSLGPADELYCIFIHKVHSVFHSVCKVEWLITDSIPGSSRDLSHLAVIAVRIERRYMNDINEGSVLSGQRATVPELTSSGRKVYRLAPLWIDPELSTSTPVSVNMSESWLQLSWCTLTVIRLLYPITNQRWSWSHSVSPALHTCTVCVLCVIPRLTEEIIEKKMSSASEAVYTTVRTFWQCDLFLF